MPSSAGALRQTQSEGNLSDPFDLANVVRMPMPAAPFTPRPILVASSSSEENSDIEMIPGQLDFMEIFSPPRVFFAMKRLGLEADVECSMDLTKGHDFLTVDARASCLRAVLERKPKFLMVSPPCTMYSQLQRLFNLHKMSEEQRAARFLEADNLLDFAMHLCKVQSDSGRYYCFEHPHRASSWDRASVKKIRDLDGSFTISFDQCQTGLVSPGSDPKPIKKRTTLLSNAPAIHHIFSPLQCACPAGAHQVIEGSIDGILVSKWAQHYPPLLCEKLAQAASQTLA